MSKKSKKKKSTSKTNNTSSLFDINIIVILIISFIVFIPSISSDYVNWDDDVNIYENPYLNDFSIDNIKNIFTSTVMGGYNPLSIFSFSLEKAFGGGAKTTHVINILLHLITVFFVYRILLLMKLNPLFAALGALLFGIHPMRVESVAWATERKDVLLGAFYFSSIYYYIQYILSKQNTKKAIKKYFYISMGLFVLALFSKIQAVALPLSLLAFDYYFNRKLDKNLIIEKIPLFALSLAIGLLGVFLLKDTGTIVDENHFGLMERIVIGSYTFWVYIIKFIFPYEMSPLYPYPTSLEALHYLSLIPSIGLVYLIYHLYKNNNKISLFSIVFFIFNVIFVLQILAAGQGYKADRFTYIAYFGLFFGVSYLLQQFSQKSKQQNLIYGGIGLYLLLMAFLTWKQSGIWKNGETLWNHTLQLYERNGTVYRNLGNYYRDNQMNDKALEIFNAGLQLLPEDATLNNSVGKLYFDKGQVDNAFTFFNQALTIEPNNIEYLNNRGVAYAVKNQYDLALQDYNKGIQINPNNLKSFENRGKLFLSIGEYQKALEDFNLVLNAYDNGEIYLNRSEVFYRLGDKNSAINDANKASELGITIPPNYIQLLNN